MPVAAVTDRHAGLFAAMQARMPQVAPQAIAKARVDGRALVIEVEGLPQVARGRVLTFFPETAGVVDPAAPIAQDWNGAEWSASVPPSPQRSASPSVMQTVLVADQAAGIQVRLDITGA